MPQPDLDEFIEHHGIKGMKWGVRRSERELARAQEGIRKANELDPDKMYVSGKGRKTRILSGEAARAANLRAVASSKSGSQVLNSKDLEFLNKRIQLDKKYAELTYQRKKNATDKIETVIKTYQKIDSFDKQMGSPVRKTIVNILAKKTGPGFAKAAASAASAASAATGAAKNASSQAKSSVPDLDDLFKPAGKPAPKQITASDILEAVYNPKTGMYEVR